MPTYRVRCKFIRTVDLYVDADSEQDVYDLTVDDQDFEPTMYPYRSDDEEWWDQDPIDIEEVDDANAELMVDGDELVIK
jgi:hypothetical protein